MRKFILPILVAGAIAFTAAQAMASATNRTASFAESHAFGTAFTQGNETFTSSEPGGNHYKKTDMLENGRHGFQLSSSILKSVAGESMTGRVTVPADDSYGYVTGENPFKQGWVANSDIPMPAPKYTQPCPDWVNTPCEATTSATDPQTEDGENVWDGTVLDDLYQTVGADDSRTIIATATTTGEKTSRTLDQNLDQLFFNGKHGTMTLAGSPGSQLILDGTTRYFNIDDTLDQDIADWSTSYAKTSNGNVVKDETTGIYGKLTMIFQLAAPVSGTQGAGSEGCASGGAYLADQGGPQVNACGAFTGNSARTGTSVGEAAGTFNAWVIDQWVVSDVWDWTHGNEVTALNGDKLASKGAGVGIQQGYSSWFLDGEHKAIDYTYEYQGGHGSINKTVNLGQQHQHPDP